MYSMNIAYLLPYNLGDFPATFFNVWLNAGRLQKPVYSAALKIGCFCTYHDV